MIKLFRKNLCRYLKDFYLNNLKKVDFLFVLFASKGFFKINFNSLFDNKKINGICLKFF